MALDPVDGVVVRFEFDGGGFCRAGLSLVGGELRLQATIFLLQVTGATLVLDDLTIMT